MNNFSHSFKSLKNPKTIAVAAMMIALNIIFTRFLSIQTIFVRISFSFLPIAVFSMLCGPVLGGLAAAVADVVGYVISPVGGSYFPGLTLSAFLYGLIFGIFFYRKELSLLRIIVANLITVIFIDLILNTVWISILNGTTIEAIFVTRLIKAAIMLPVQILVIYLFQKLIGKKLQTQFEK